jgi:hypothetical protein
MSRVSRGSTGYAGPGREFGPPRGAQRGLHRLLDRRGVVLIRDRIGSGHCRPTGYRQITQRGSGRLMAPMVTNPLPISVVGWRIDVDLLPTELIIDRCFTHAVRP